MNSEPSDRARVRELLGRDPQSPYEVVVRDEAGDPVVLRNSPFLDDGTPMPTLYWLIGPDEIRRVGRLEAAGGVNAAEADIAQDELAQAHARYAAERDAMIPLDHVGPRPSGGVGGTRLGVKCLHAHWAWHLAGGDDPVGRWVAAHLELPADDPEITSNTVTVIEDQVRVQLTAGIEVQLPWGPNSLTGRWLADTDPPRPEALTNALGTVADHLDDLLRDHPTFVDVSELTFEGPAIEALARTELGTDRAPELVELPRHAAEEVFRIVATESTADRAHNPGLPSEHVDTIIATCCIVLAFVRRLHLDQVVLRTRPAS